MDAKEVSARLFATRENARQFCFDLFPNGVLRGNEFLTGSLKGESGEACVMNLVTGAWHDNAAGDRGEECVSYWAAAKGLTQADAIAKLSVGMLNGNGAANGAAVVPYIKPADRTNPDVLEVPPEDASSAAECFRHPKHGLPSSLSHYLTVQGDLWFINAHYQAKGKRDSCPWIWKGGWRAEAPPRPRPLYGLERVDAFPEAHCIVVEDEHTADVMRDLIKDRPIVTWYGEPVSITTAAWTPLWKRKVLVWCRADEVGEKTRQILCNQLTEVNCDVSYVDTDGLPAGLGPADMVAQGRSRIEISKLVIERMQPWEGGKPKPAAKAVRFGDPVAEIWKEAQLTLNAQGNPHNNEANIIRIMQHAERNILRIEVWWDTFLSRMLYLKNGETHEWNEAQDTRLTAWIQDEYKIPNLKLATVERGLKEYIERNPRNCVVEYLESHRWDNVPRLEQLLPRGFGTVDDVYTQAVGRCFLMGMVARAMHPGCKVDCLPVFEGKQGNFKSSALKILGAPWHSEIHDSILTKDFVQALQGMWLIEISELSSFRKHEMTAIKGRISDPSDRFRPSFGRYTRNWPRQCVMAASTNETNWATDDTGARRFWPVKCGNIDLDWIADNKNQLFAEATHRYRAGEPWHNVPQAEAEAEQKHRHMDDPWLETIRSFVGTRTIMRMSDILDELHIPLERRTMSEARRAAACLRALGFYAATIWEGKECWRGFRRYAEPETVKKDPAADF